MTNENNQRCFDPSQIEIDHLMPGADVIHVGSEQIALGFPEEVVKAWLRAGKQITCWLVPDVRQSRGIVQWAFEFPLYHALFVQGLFGKKQKMTVLTHERDWADLVEYLRLTLLGLTRDELKREGVAPGTIEVLCREGEAMALKHADGRIAQVEDFLQPRFFDARGEVEYNGLRIKTHGNNTYSVFATADRLEEYRLDVEADAAPPYSQPLTPATAPMAPQPFELSMLGTGNGFDVKGPCTSQLVQANGRFMLIDAGPYVRTLLSHAGVSLDQVSALVITHAHEDHAAGLSALLDLTHRLKLFTTRETAAILRRKLALLNPTVASPGTLLDECFDLVCIEPSKDYDYYGLRLRFHYTMHSIPCVGVQLAMRDGSELHSALIVGDNNSRANIDRARQQGVIAPARHEELTRLYGWRGDLVVADAGAGLIHGVAADFKDNPSRNVVYVHTTTLKGEEQHRYTLAEPGHRYPLIGESSRPAALERGLARRALVEAFGGADNDWLEAMLDAASAHNVNRHQIVLRRDDTGQDLFVAISGELGVMVADDDGARKVATLHAGEIFGEMAAIKGAPRSASVVAETPARLLRVPGEVFFRFAAETRLLASLPELWAKRRDLERVGFLARASVTARNQLARQAVRRTIQPGATLIREGSRSNAVFVLVAGRVQVYKGDAPLLVNGAPIIVNAGSLIGETAPFLRQARNASIVTLDECEVLAIPGNEFKQIIERSPQLFCNISQVVRQRQAA
ncbi:MAG: cyclic nucleotide-binding domain-containing protein [Deltaproteobacteria bacterium]|nr:cyclic nucleotide-binding domain-containing protein [Deltaproteobacteria bacterium]